MTLLGWIAATFAAACEEPGCRGRYRPYDAKPWHDRCGDCGRGRGR